MPRRKKNGQSPARVPGGPSEGGSLRHNMGYRLPQGFDGAMTNNFPTSTPYSSSDKEKIVRSMQEMFSHLDPEVIYIVLSESDFKVENAMDSLLELSVAADVAKPTPSHVSGFERTAAALLSPCHISEPRPDPESSEPSQLTSSPPTTNLLTEELDLLVDQELETLTAQQGFNDEHHSSQYLSVGTTLPSVPQPPTPQQVLPELLQSSLVPGSRGPFGDDLLEYTSGASCPLNQPSIWEDKTTKEPQSVVDFTHLMTEMPVDKTVSPLDLASSGRSSAFQVYKKQEPSHALSDTAGVMPSQAVVRGASSKVNQEPLGYSSSQWNLQAPVFSPHIHGNQGPAFIIPVAQAPSNWPRQPRHASPWLIQAPLKPFASVPKSWSQPTAPHPPTRYSRLRLEGRLLVLLRGAPGSGKTTLAKALLEYNPGGIILSTDDYFTRNGAYQFDPTALGEAHHWNYKRAKEAFEMGVTPIIIDNTNMQGWEMKPYVAQAQKSGYKVLFREPDTWWKNKPRELERRTTHNVPVEKIRRMLNNYERNVTISSIMGSQTPEIKQRFLQENTSPQPAAETACPDLVGQPGSTEEYKKSHPELCSSLPDVSAIGRSSEVGILEDGSHKSTESLNSQPTGRLQENPELTNRDDDIDMGELDSELDTYLEVNHPIGDKGIPDCIVESVMSEDYHGDEIPVAFSESIAQRVRRERPSRRSGFERLEPADLVKDTNQSDSKADKKEKPKEVERVEMVRDEGEKEMMLDFAGHWPCDVGSLEQRQVRRRQRHGKEDGEGVSEEADKTKSKLQPGPNVTEFQKLLDFIQTGVADLQTSHPSSLSQSSGEELEKDEEACGLFEESHGSRSNSEERVQNMNRVDSSRDELPDCVLDWKAADSCKVIESRIDIWDGLKTESDARSPTGGNGNMLEIESETDCVDLKATSSNNPLSDPLVISKPMEAKVCHDGVESHNIEGEDGTEPAAGHSNTNKNNSDKNGRASRAEADGSNISEECQSPVCEGSVGAESSAFSGGSQERKHRQGRRSGKQCKLALTFTQNCPASSLNALECPSTMVHSINTDVENDFNPNWSLTSDSTEAKLEAHLQPPSPLPLGDTDCPTQTEPHDFALLWRLNRQDSPDDAVATACNHPSDIAVLSGDSCRFVPELSTVVSAAAAVQPSGHREVPYHVVHEKGTQVEEKELGKTQDRLESLRILSRHFKLVSFDTLEDLYDKCHQDLEWTTNLLLDSGERFFRDDDGDREGEDDARGEDITLSESAGARLCSNVIEYHPEGWPEGEPTGFEEVTQQSAFETVGESDGCAAVQVRNKDHPDATSPLKTSSQANVSLPHEVHEREGCGDTENKVTSEAHLEGSAWGGSLDDGVITEESRVEMEEEMANMDEVHRLLQAELEDMEREQKQKKEEERTQRRHVEERRSRHVDIQSVELKLPTEVALQLIELFGPIGVDLGTCLTDDYAVQMDLNLAKLLHQKWKETIQEKKRQARLSFHLLQESSVHWGEPPAARPGSHDRTQSARFLISADGYASLDSQPEAHNPMPLMDHWNVSRPHVSLRDIIKEEQALQENVGKTRQIRDGAALLKENQLYSLFPNIDRHFLQDIFRDHNYSLTQTELFLRSLLEEEPVKTVVAPEAPRSDHVRAASKEREKRQKPLELPVLDYQDTEDPEYEDFRAEANQQRRQQLESFSKAAEAYKQGRKDVASFYAQQGHLHGQRMREANHRAAVQIFQRVNSSLLPRNILDLHGLHVDEALEHLAQVLQDKTADCEQGLCRPQLSVITGRGNHSQGGVARIRPAVIDYLTSKHYRFTEPKPGHVLVSLK